MQLLYNIGIHFYGLALRIAAWFHPKAKMWVTGRKDFYKNVNSIDSNSNILWFHCASLGEFDMALPVMNAMKTQVPNAYILVSFFSPSGMQHYNKRHHQVDQAVYLPLDTPKNAQQFISFFKPKHLFLVKYEFWSNFILKSKENNVKIFSICTLLRPNHRFFKFYGGFFRKTLKQIDFFYVQNKKSGFLLNSINIDRFMVVGDTRYDRVLENKARFSPIPRIEAFLRHEKAIILGSTWPKDENLLFDFIKSRKDSKFIIAPHQIDDEHIEEIENGLLGQTQRFSKGNENDKRILIIDNIGYLTNAYAYGLWAYVGGGFSGSLHNILEPAAYELPVIFGPKYQRFPEAEQFIDYGIGFSVADQNELQSVVAKIEEQIHTFSDKINVHLNQNKGADHKIIDDWKKRFL